MTVERNPQRATVSSVECFESHVVDRKSVERCGRVIVHQLKHIERIPIGMIGLKDEDEVGT
jgi:hypothetical protein